MHQIKQFHSKEDVNAWLREQANTIRVKNVTVTAMGTHLFYTAHYTIKNEDE